MKKTNIISTMTMTWETNSVFGGFGVAEMKKLVGHKKKYLTRLRLLFKPYRFSYDTSDKDGSTTTVYKEHDGKAYIYEVTWFPPKNTGSIKQVPKSKTSKRRG